MLSSHHPLKITKSFLNIPVSKLSACKAHSQWNWDLLLSKECCEAGRLFTGLDADTWHSDYLPSAWARKMWAEITFTSRMTLPPESSDLLKYGTDVRVTEVPFSHCPGSCREWFFDSFLAVMLPQRGGRACEAFPYLGYTDISTRRESETEGWYLKTLWTPQRYFLPNYYSQKIHFIQSTFPTSLVCTAAVEKQLLRFLAADFAQGNLAAQLHHSWLWSPADQTACPPCTLPRGCTSKAWMGKHRHSAGIRAD